MSDPHAPLTPEARIESAMRNGPEFEAAGRFGVASRFARRLVGRAVAYERDYHNRINVALLEKVHEVEADARRSAATTEERRSIEATVEDLSLRVAALQSRLGELDERTAVATSIASGAVSTAEHLTRDLTPLRRAIDSLERLTGDLTPLRNAIDALEQRTAQHQAMLGDVAVDAQKAQFVYDELTAQPYVAPGYDLRITDEQGREQLGYRDGHGGPLYVGFEDIFRGAPEFVEKRQRAYVDMLADRGRVIDLGCGRGEMLTLLQRAGVDVEGVDLDEAMVDRARAASGVPVEHGDAIEFLAKQADASIGAIFSAQFVEHLPPARLPELLEVARVKLAPGGAFVAETVNPHSPRALKSFWIDPTHQHPLFPETLLALCRLTGYARADIEFPLGGDDLDTNLRTCGEFAVSAVVEG